MSKIEEAKQYAKIVKAQAEENKRKTQERIKALESYRRALRK